MWQYTYFQIVKFCLFYLYFKLSVPIPNVFGVGIIKQLSMTDFILLQILIAHKNVSYKNIFLIKNIPTKTNYKTAIELRQLLNLFDYNSIVLLVIILLFGP